MNAKVMDSEKPQAVNTWRTSRSRRIDASGGACGATSAGNVVGSRSNP
jgi:hypothetical protein